jgi:hypothetical protein
MHNKNSADHVAYVDFTNTSLICDASESSSAPDCLMRQIENCEVHFVQCDFDHTLQPSGDIVAWMRRS